MAYNLENKQMLHIISEIIVLIGLTFYFNQKNKKLLNHIEDLAQRLEEQEELIQKHENIIIKLVSSVNELNGNSLQSKKSNTTYSTQNKISPKIVLPDEVLPEEVLPEEVLSKTVLPEEVLPEEVLPEEVLSKTVLPEEVLPERVLPERVLPKKVLPKKVLTEGVLHQPPTHLLQNFTTIIEEETSNFDELQEELNYIETNSIVFNNSMQVLEEVQEEAQEEAREEAQEEDLDFAISEELKELLEIDTDDLSLKKQ